MKNKLFPFAAVALMGCSGCALATEGGGSTYASGVENYLVGAVPPPGLYVLNYDNLYVADKLKDGLGQQVPVPGFKVNAAVVATRVVWSTPQPVLGGNLVFHTIIPVVDLKVSAAGASQHKTGVGDITVGVGVARHHSESLHTVAGLDLVLPTGSYNKADLANIGRNYASLQPLFALTYLQSRGFNGDFKLTFNLNQKNKDTQFSSGDEVFLDFATGYGMGNGWTLGVGGYVRRQLSSDTQAGAVLANSRSSAFALGPSVRYDNGKGWFITAKFQAESAVRNGSEGKAFWIKTAIPF